MVFQVLERFEAGGVGGFQVSCGRYQNDRSQQRSSGRAKNKEDQGATGASSAGQEGNHSSFLASACLRAARLCTPS